MKMSETMESIGIDPREELELTAAISCASERMDPRSRRDIRRRVVAAAGGERLRAQRLVFARAAAAFTVTASMLSGVSVAAAASLPGDALYPLKSGAEQVTLAVLPEGRAEESYLFRLAARRGEEADRLLERGASAAEVEAAIGRFRVAVEMAFSTGGRASGRWTATAGQNRLMEQVTEMAAAVKAGYEAGAAGRGYPGDTGGATGSSGSGSDKSGPANAPTPGSGGSGSSTGSSPSDDPGSGSGASGSGGGTGAGDGSGGSDPSTQKRGDEASGTTMQRRNP